MQSLVTSYKEQVALEKVHKSKSKRYRIKPSLLGAKCVRKILYDSMRIERDFDTDIDAQCKMKLGDLIEAELVDTWRKLGIVIDYYNPDGTTPVKYGTVNKQFCIQSDLLDIPEAYLDALVVLDGRLYIVECKSSNDDGFKKLSTPKPDHKIQGTCYLAVFNKMLAEGKFDHIKELAGFKEASAVIYVYYNKNDSQLKEFIMPLDASLLEFSIKRTLTLKQYRDRKILPPKTQFFCNTCEWRIKCGNNYCEWS